MLHCRRIETAYRLDWVTRLLPSKGEYNNPSLLANLQSISCLPLLQRAPQDMIQFVSPIVLVIHIQRITAPSIVHDLRQPLIQPMKARIFHPVAPAATGRTLGGPVFQSSNPIVQMKYIPAQINNNGSGPGIESAIINVGSRSVAVALLS